MLYSHNSVWLTLISWILDKERMGKFYDGEKNLKFYERLGLYFYSEESLYLLVDEADPYIYNFPHSFEKAYFE